MASSGMEIAMNAKESSRTNADPPTFPLVSISSELGFQEKAR